MKQVLRAPRACVWLSAAALLALSGCSGEVTSPAEGGTGGAGAAGGGGASAGSGGATGPSVEEGADPGRVTLHRLNRAEYNNTVQALFGTELTPADDFPNDDHGFGFDHIADVLSVSPVLIELYDRAAEQLIEEALFPPTAEPGLFFVEAEEATASVGSGSGSAWNLWSNGSVSSVLELPADGIYKMSARAWQSAGGPDPAEMIFQIDGIAVATFAVEADGNAPGVYEAEIELTAGLRDVHVVFTNDYYDPDAGEDRNLLVDWFQVEGPMDLEPADTSQRDAILTCDPAEIGVDPCAEQILRTFGKRVWRRPLADAEVADLLAFVHLAEQEGDDFVVGMSLAIHAMLLSPHFIFRVELDPDPASPEAHALDDYEVASRLSYFLWSSMPDAELFAAADAGKLQDPAEIERQVLRMLDDPRSWALVDNFAGQWLYMRALDSHSPDVWAYPSWDDELRHSMRRETELFFRTFIDEDRSLTEMLTATDTFLDARLASHYGLPAPQSPGADGFERVQLDEAALAERGGLLSQGSVLTVHSYPTRTSPVKRGKWVLSELLCSEPPPPPPGVEGLEEAQEEGLTLAEALAKHREDPICASCHMLMDPIGLGLENYNGIGEWRDTEVGKPITPAGELPDGTAFSSARELAEILAADPRFGACATEKLFIYALGRGPTKDDEIYLESIAEHFASGGHRFRDLAVLIATSEPFRMRRGEPTPDSAGEN